MRKTTLSERLVELLTLRGKRPADLARAVGVSEAAVSLWIKSGTQSLKSNNLLAVSAFFNCSPTWLATGEGPMMAVPDRATLAEPAADSAVTISQHQAAAQPYDGVLINQFDTGGKMGHGLVLRDQPGIIRSWQVSEEWVQKNVHSVTSVKNLAIVTGFGDSMRPLYNPGDPLLVDTGVRTVDFDGIYFFRISDEGFVKRLQRIPGQGVRVISDNKAYDPWHITDGMDFEVFARVVKVWRGDDF